MTLAISLQKKQDDTLYSTFFRKKAEKVVSAIYFITNHFSEDEILKWQLRKKGVQLLSDTLSFNKNQIAFREEKLFQIKNSIVETLSYLEIAVAVKIISEMNFNIFKRELSFLLSLVENNLQKLDEADALELNGEYFRIKEKQFNPKKKQVQGDFIKDISLYKGHSKQDKGHKNTALANTERKIDRRNIIAKLLSKGQKLTIKDISKMIRDCGEKTIQRELQAMLTDGLLTKTGERRWSRYSLKH